MFKQCRLVQGETRAIGWIPIRGAKLNANIEVFDLGGRWTVEQVFDYGIDPEALKEFQRKSRKSFSSLEDPREKRK